MNKLKRTLIIGAGIASIGVAGATGITAASALSGTDASTGTSLIDKLVSKFHLNRSEVQAVFKEGRSEHQAAMKAKQTEALKTALSNGKLTQAQYDHIVAAQAEINTLMNSAESPHDLSDATKSALKTKFDTLRDWMKTQNISPADIGIGFGHGGRGSHGPGEDSDDASATDIN